MSSGSCQALSPHSKKFLGLNPTYSWHNPLCLHVYLLIRYRNMQVFALKCECECVCLPLCVSPVTDWGHGPMWSVCACWEVTEIVGRSHGEFQQSCGEMGVSDIVRPFDKHFGWSILGPCVVGTLSHKVTLWGLISPLWTKSKKRVPKGLRL